jgi:ribose transport system ATP-binding protein
MMETHHRVKNNLQSVAAVVDIELMKHGETIPAESVQRVRDYVRTLASLHRVLTQQAKEDASTETVSSRAALENLIPLLQDGAPSAHLSLSSDDIPLTMRQATAICILTNELVHNAARAAANIQVRFAASNGRAELIVSDDGPGFGNVPDQELSSNTGLQLVESVSEWDLRGRAEFANRGSGGAEVTVRFPLQADHAASL